MTQDRAAYVTRRNRCRLCDSTDLTLVLGIEPSPIGDAFVTKEHLHEVQPLIPLDVYQCRACGHAQNLDIANPDLLFRNYTFTTSSSRGLIEHFKRYAIEARTEFGLRENDLVVEIGSNDGTLLGNFKDAGLRIQGVDPAADIAKRSTEKGIPTIPEFFTEKLSRRIRNDQGPAQLVVANNVYAHADNLSDVTHGIRHLLDSNGIFMFEVSYLLDMIDGLVFDTIYHEHQSYHSIVPLRKFLAAHDLHLFDVRKVGTKGGSIRGYAQPCGGTHAERPIVASMVAEEDIRQLHLPEIFRDYQASIKEQKDAVNEFVGAARRSGKRVVGYGASTTTTTLLYHFGLQDSLDYLVDDNPVKQGLYSPGRHLEVKPSSVLYDVLRPDIVLILAWQFCDAILERHDRFIADGGIMVSPLKQFTVYRR